MFEVKKACRAQVKLRIGLFGFSGCGKTMSALRLAKGLVGSWDKICIIDTENNSASLYSHLGDFLTLDFQAPYHPSRFADAITFIEKNHPQVECIIIDSISHEYEGAGGLTQIVLNFGGQPLDWAKANPIHKIFLDKMLNSKCHIISCGRVKSDYAMTESNGKMKFKKVGLKVSSKEGFEYEMTTAFRIDGNHLATTDKDRTELFKDDVAFLITEETGEAFARWSMGGEAPNVFTENIHTIYKALGKIKQAYTQKKYGQIIAQVKNKELDDEKLKEFIEVLNDIKNKTDDEILIENQPTKNEIEASNDERRF